MSYTEVIKYLFSKYIYKFVVFHTSEIHVLIVNPSQILQQKINIFAIHV